MVDELTENDCERIPRGGGLYMEKNNGGVPA